MAKLKDFTDASGVTHTAAYWLPIQVNRNKVEKTAFIVFQAWKDQVAREAGLYPISGAQKTYSVTGADFDTYLADSVLTGDTDLSKQAYLLADARLDTNGQSFFNGATDA